MSGPDLGPAQPTADPWKALDRGCRELGSQLASGIERSEFDGPLHFSRELREALLEAAAGDPLTALAGLASAVFEGDLEAEGAVGKERWRARVAYTGTIQAGEAEASLALTWLKGWR